MTNLLSEGPMWRRGLAASIALVGACTMFVSVVLIVLGAVMTKALGPTPAAALGNSGSPGAKQDTSLSTSASEKGSTDDASKQVGASAASKGQS